MLFVGGLIAVLSGIAVPQMLVSLDRSRGYAAARYLGGRLALARTQAVMRGAAVALKFTEESRGFSFTVYQDGNRNGVRTADIQRQVDRLIEPATRLYEQFPGVEIATTSAVSGGDPVQIGGSNLLSFSPTGTATSGTIYITGRDGTQWAVRVLGGTGRVRVLRYDTTKRNWVESL